MMALLPSAGLETFGVFIEVLALTLFFYASLRFLRNTRGVGMLRGMAVLFAFAFLVFSVLSIYPGVPVLGHLLGQVAPYLVLILFILFQPELRQGLSRFGRAGMFRMLDNSAVTEQGIPEVVDAAQRMANERIGALIAFERQDSLASFRENAVAVNAPVSAILLETIFFPGSPLHDGAVIVRDDEVLSAACLLPLISGEEKLGRLGTRHRAALGLTEDTDAVTLAVSEETGQISLCAAGEIHRPIPHDQLHAKLDELLRTPVTTEATAPAPGKDSSPSSELSQENAS